METLFAVGIGIGLSSIAGVRAFLPLVLVGLFARLGLFTLSAPFGFLDDWPVIAVFAGLALGSTRGFDDDVWLLAVAAIVLQTVRHSVDFSYAAGQHHVIATVPMVPLAPALAPRNVSPCTPTPAL